MSHTVLRTGYAEFVDRLNRFPQGAPVSDTLYKILQVLLSEEEARLLALLPIKPFTARQASQVWSMTPAEAGRTLDLLSSRAILVDAEHDGETVYVLPPPMAGFFEFSMMRTRGDVDQKLLSELFYQYLNVEEDFIRALFVDGETQLGRTFVHEPALPAGEGAQVLDYERASEVIRCATHRGVSLCYCRHKMSHLGKACKAPTDICMTFNTTAQSLIRHGYARPVDALECLDLLGEAYENNLVQFGENVQQDVNFICNCCGCCCEAMIAARRFGLFHPVHTTNYLPAIDPSLCNGCGKCADACPVEAMSLVSANDPHALRRKRAKFDEERCLGCGVCVRVCPRGALSLRRRAQRVITPVDSVHRVVMMAIERGKLQNLIFDNRVLWNHRALAAVLGAILRLPPVKRAMAGRQFRSQYLAALICRLNQ
jgi:ferredoxin